MRRRWPCGISLSCVTCWRWSVHWTQFVYFVRIFIAWHWLVFRSFYFCRLFIIWHNEHVLGPESNFIHFRSWVCNRSSEKTMNFTNRFGFLSFSFSRVPISEAFGHRYPLRKVKFVSGNQSERRSDILRGERVKSGSRWKVEKVAIKR